MLIPSIDIKNRYCVRLRGGKFSCLTSKWDLVSELSRILEQGAKRVHIVDLEGSLGRPNLSAISLLCKNFSSRASFQLGGGVRSLKTIETYLLAGVSEVVLSTLAVLKPQFLSEACSEFPNKIILGLDGSKEFITTNAWKQSSRFRLNDYINLTKSFGIKWIVYTATQADGKLNGLDLPATLSVSDRSILPLVASGGLSSSEELKRLQKESRKLVGVVCGSSVCRGFVNLLSAGRFFSLVDND